ncbi:MAG TPA: hypothetical protein VFU38_08205 [Candidatus Krumholzibacteria bacterium]|nr:hypothetical protein [Candidatus Krumholzibacteria bacterium]
MASPQQEENVDYQSFGAVGRLLFVASIVVTVINAIWRHGDIDLTGKHANMRTLYLRSIILGVIVAALARINVVAMLRDEAAFDAWITFPQIDLFDDVVGILITGVVIAFLSKVWNDLFDVLYEFKRWLRGKANALRPDEGAARIRDPREGGGRDMRRGRRGGSRGGRPMGGGGGLGVGGDRDRDNDRDRFRDRDRDRDRDRGGEREIRRPEIPREPGGNP